MSKTYGKFITEARDKYKEKDERMRNCHGPIMKADGWVDPDKLENLVKHKEVIDNKYGDGHQTMYVGHHTNHWTKKQSGPKVAILTGGKPDPDSISSRSWSGAKPDVGYNKPHSWYEDTGMGNKEHPSTSLTITGHAHIHPDGKVEYHGDVDPKAKHRMWVYK
jgi:hypothetical protein